MLFHVLVSLSRRELGEFAKVVSVTVCEWGRRGAVTELVPAGIAPSRAGVISRRQTHAVVEEATPHFKST